MNATDTRSQLLAEVAANPEDDTLRLAFADWLDEQPAGRKACPLDFCRGGYWRHSGDPHTRLTRCHVCGPDGTVPDTADRDRAEFVRVQCEWSSWERPGGMFEVPPTASGKKRLKWCLDRQGELLDAHPEWSRCPCPECGGEDHNDQSICDTCGGTGDLFLAPVNPNRSDTQSVTEPRTVTFARGFIDSVTCTLAEAFTPDGTPTPWAVAVVRQTPVTRFVLGDRIPDYDRADRRPVWYSVEHVSDAAGGPRNVPAAVLAEMTGYDKVVCPPHIAKWYPTAEAATDALALAAGRLVRRHAYRERT